MVKKLNYFTIDTGSQDGHLEFSSGDLIVLDKNSNGETIEVTGSGYGSCQRTGHTGKVSGALFYIIPIIETPGDSLLVSTVGTSGKCIQTSSL